MKAGWIIGIILGAILLGLQYRLWMSDNSFPEAWTLQKKVTAQHRKNARLKARNHKMANDIRDLKHGHEAIEAHARRELGMTKPGETFYKILKPAQSHAASSDKTFPRPD